MVQQPTFCLLILKNALAHLNDEVICIGFSGKVPDVHVADL